MPLDAGTIRGGIDWDISSYTKGMLQAEAIAKIFPNVVTAFIADPLLGVAEIAREAFDGVAHAFEFGVDAAREYAGAIAEVAESERTAQVTAQTLGLSVEAFTGMAAAAKLAGSDAMAFAEGLKFLNRNVADAAYGNLELRKEFWELGVQTIDSTGHLRDTQSVLFDVADAISRIPDASVRTRFAMDLLGRGAEGMIPFLMRGSAGIKEFQKEAERFGATTSTAAAESGEKFQHLREDWDLMWEGIKKKASDPAIKLIADHFDDIQKAMFRLSDVAAKGITFGFDWLIANQEEIKADFLAIGDAAKSLWAKMLADAPLVEAEIKKIWDECAGWKDYVVASWPAISAEFKEIETGAESLITAIKGIYDGWVGARNALEAYMHAAGDQEVKASNDIANQLQKGTGSPVSASFPFMGQDVPGMDIAMGHVPAPPAVSKTNIAPTSQPATQNAPITVHVNLDPKKTASEIGNAIAPVIQKGISDAKNSSLAQTRKATQKAGM